MNSGAVYGPQPAADAICCVCQLPIKAGERQWAAHHRGRQYVVCCPGCVQLFNRAPLQFAEQP